MRLILALVVLLACSGPAFPAEESNAENLLILTDAKLAKTYTTNWTAHAAHSVKYQGKMKDAQK